MKKYIILPTKNRIAIHNGILMNFNIDKNIAKLD